MKISALIPSSDQVVKMEYVIKQAKKLGVDEIVVALKPKQKLKIKGVREVKGGLYRGLDYNAAAKAAKGDILLLLHQNTIAFPKGLVKDIKKAFEDKSVVGGGVDLAFDKEHWFLNIVEFMSNQYRMRFRKIMYCDQTMFLRKGTYKKMKGFKRMIIFEDTDFSVRLAKLGNIICLKGPVVTSAHRFEKSGVFKQTFKNQLLKLMYHMGASQKRMKQVYERL